MKTCLFLSIAMAIVLGGCGRPLASPTTVMGEVGNGGHGYVARGRVHLVDLVEAGLETVDTLGEDEYKKGNNFAALLRDGVRTNQNGKESLFPYAAVGRKLHQLYKVDPVLTMALLETMRMYQWNFIDMNLSPLTLRGGVISFEEGSMILVANRRGRSIFVCLGALERMNEVNRAATIFHEAIYALIKPTTIGARVTQNAARVREIVAHIFSRSNFTEDVERRRFAELIGSDEFPTAKARIWNVTFASHLAPSPLGRVMIFEPQLFIKDDDKFALEIDSHRDVENLRKTLDGLRGPRTYFEAKLHFEVTATHPKNQGLRFQFAEYEEDKDLKTYVKTTPLVEPFSVAVHAETHHGNIDVTDDVILRSWIALLRVFQDYNPSHRESTGGHPYHLRTKALKLGLSQKVLLPSVPFVHLMYRKEKDDDRDD